jgi:hypothetical protein
MIPVQMEQNGHSVSTTVMVDSGASGIGYINRSFAQQEHLVLRRLARPISIFGFDGEEIVHGRITHAAHVKIHYLNHTERIRLFVTTLGKHAAILGLPWMKKHGAVPDWDAQIIRFTNSRCQREHAASQPKGPPGQSFVQPGPGLEQSLPGRPPGDTRPARRKKRRPLSITRRHDDWKYAFERNLNPKSDSDLELELD